MIERLCKNGLHPTTARRFHKNGRAYCAPCRRSARDWRQQAGGNVGVWQTPKRDEERHARYAVWAAGLDAAIAAIRERDGFDGRTRTWRTLGDVVGMQTAVREPVAIAPREQFERMAS